MSKAQFARKATLLGGIVVMFLVAIAPLDLYAGHLDGTGGFRYTIEGEGGSSTVYAAGNNASGDTSVDMEVVPREQQRDSTTPTMLSLVLDHARRYLGFFASFLNR